MNGHQQVVALRESGYRPTCVFINIGPTPPARRLTVAPERMLEQGGIPEVWTDGESPALADLRFLKGLRVHVSLMGGARAEFWPWWDAVVNAQPDHAFGLEPDGEVLEWRAS